MVFSSLVFLFIFLPSAIIGNTLLPSRCRNIFLLAISLLFYAWGEGGYLLLMLFSIGVNYLLGRLLSAAAARHRSRLVAVGVVINLLPLLFYKYTVFLSDALQTWFPTSELFSRWSGYDIHLPIGISFFTFQAISYLIDVARRQVEPQRSMIDLGLYIALFPQLIAGPIVRYAQISRQLSQRVHSSALFAQGIERFVFGLAKKVLLANPLGAMADAVFHAPADTLTAPIAWLGLASYTLQIYFDFSGYSDMAIGLGRMFGFHFPENFDNPYISRSLREFWRRWHISLSTWFRDYLYIPLGGNKHGQVRTAANLLLVFFLCGLWHGASWNFIVWGLFHGAFLTLERGRFGHWLQLAPRILQHGYTLAVVMIAWTFFRAEDMPHATAYLQALLGFSTGETMPVNVLLALNSHFLVVLASGILLAGGVYRRGMDFIRAASRTDQPRRIGWHRFISLPKTGLLGLLLIASSMSLATGAYNPFIYFRF